MALGGSEKNGLVFIISIYTYNPPDFWSTWNEMLKGEYKIEF